MDTALSNGDFAEDKSGKMYRISGIEETLQRCKILLGIKRGSFCYNRNLGSDIDTLADDDEYLEGNALLLVREALLPIKQLTVKRVVPIKDGNHLYLNITVEVYQEIAEFEVSVH